MADEKDQDVGFWMEMDQLGPEAALPSEARPNATPAIAPHLEYIPIHYYPVKQKLHSSDPAAYLLSSQPAPVPGGSSDPKTSAASNQQGRRRSVASDSTTSPSSSPSSTTATLGSSREASAKSSPRTVRLRVAMPNSASAARRFSLPIQVPVKPAANRRSQSEAQLSSTPSPTPKLIPAPQWWEHHIDQLAMAVNLALGDLPAADSPESSSPPALPPISESRAIQFKALWQAATKAKQWLLEGGNLVTESAVSEYYDFNRRLNALCHRLQMTTKNTRAQPPRDKRINCPPPRHPMSDQPLAPSEINLHIGPESGPRVAEATSTFAQQHNNLAQLVSPPTAVGYPSEKIFQPLRRRFSVSAEPVIDVPANGIEAAAIVQAEAEQMTSKSDGDETRLQSLIRKDALFRSLAPDQIYNVICAMTKREYPKDSIIIREGDTGTEMFVIDEGEVNVYYEKGTKHVAVLHSGQAFGEIALMYNCPRTATIQATMPCVLWVLASKPFKRIIMATSIQKREKYSHFLSQVELLKSLTAFERAKIADALEPIEFEDGDRIVNQGDVNASDFFIVESGTVNVYKHDPQDPNSEELFVREYTSGGYFGELALLQSIPRQATCIAKGPVRCLVLSREHFFQVMSGVEFLLRSKVYETYRELIDRRASAATTSSEADSPSPVE